MSNSSNRAANRRGGKARRSNIYHNVRDPLVVNASASSLVSADIVTDANGNFTVTHALTPLGISGIKLVSGSFNYSTWSAPKLPWMYGQARQFERYRVLRATLIFTGSVASTSTARIMMSSDTDLIDSLTPPTIATSSGGRVFNLSQSASKDLRLQLDVDSSWKKVSNNTALLGSTGMDILVVNSSNDLLFSVVNVVVAGGPVSTNIGSLAVEYDVEFRDPIAPTANS